MNCVCKKLQQAIDLLKEMGFKVSTEIEKPSIKIKTAVPIMSKTSGKLTNKEYIVKAHHESRTVNHTATMELHELFEEDNSFLLTCCPKSFSGYSGNLSPDLWLEVYGYEAY